MAVDGLIRTWGAGAKPLAGGAAPTPQFLSSALVDSTKATGLLRNKRNRLIANAWIDISIENIDQNTDYRHDHSKKHH